MSDVTKARDLVTGRYLQALQRPGLAYADQAGMIRDFEKELDAYAKAQPPQPTPTGITIGGTFGHVCRTDLCPTPRVFVGIDCYGGAWHAFSAGEAIDRMDRNTLVVQEIEEGPTPGTSKTTFHYPKNTWATLYARAKQ